MKNLKSHMDLWLEYVLNDISPLIEDNIERRDLLMQMLYQTLVDFIDEIKN